ncbi:hypothetical protein DPMN_079490 [Dreissena polymorpha]|uniref:Uncharacterized protein n=1 Tax=Dreissena polymorpha TaxID=45954 RepID=A0A9D4BQ41_DREPO|nr:hypothetical protein DPMN_079490 [Dreissena polymorpha]
MKVLARWVRRDNATRSLFQSENLSKRYVPSSVGLETAVFSVCSTCLTSQSSFGLINGNVWLCPSSNISFTVPPVKTLLVDQPMQLRGLLDLLGFCRSKQRTNIQDL